MEKANSVVTVHKARIVAVAPRLLKEIALRMEFSASECKSKKEKVMFPLTDDIILLYDPEEGEVVTERSAARYRAEEVR